MADIMGRNFRASHFPSPGPHHCTGGECPPPPAGPRGVVRPPICPCSEPGAMGCCRVRHRSGGRGERVFCPDFGTLDMSVGQVSQPSHVCTHLDTKHAPVCVIGAIFTKGQCSLWLCMHSQGKPPLNRTPHPNGLPEKKLKGASQTRSRCAQLRSVLSDLGEKFRHPAPGGGAIALITRKPTRGKSGFWGRVSNFHIWGGQTESSFL